MGRMDRRVLLAMALVALVGCSVASSLDVGDFSVNVPDVATADWEAEVDAPPDGIGPGLDQWPEEVTDQADEPDTTLPPPILWPNEGYTPEFPLWFSKQKVTDVSTWSHRVEKSPNPPEFRYLGDLGVGNGRVFSLVGYSYPFNTLHSMVGPTYDKGEGFYGDVWVELSRTAEGKALAWTAQWLGQVRGTDLTITVSENPVVSLWTLDVAPRLEDENDPLHLTFLRFILVTNNHGIVQTDLWLHARFARMQQIHELGVLESRPGRQRLALYPGHTQESVATEFSLSLPLGTMGPMEERVVVLAFHTGSKAPPEAAFLNDMTLSDFALALDLTKVRWGELLEGSLTVHSPDVRVDDYLEGIKVVLLTQQAVTGATCPMSEYTRTWLRDIAGPVRYLARVGMWDAAHGMLDYLYRAAVLTGEIQNSYPADLEENPAVDPPDWPSQPPMSGRGRAEAPSYIPMCHYWLWKASGFLDWTPNRLDFLVYALEGQSFEDGLLPYSGDETFRTAMAVAHDLPATESFEEGYVSANSSILWAAAARYLADLYSALGRDVKATELRQRADDVEARFLDTFVTSSGMVLPYLHTPDQTLAPTFYEDVSNQPIWAGLWDPFDSKAVDNLREFVQAVGGESGFAVSPLPDSYKNFMGLPMSEGIYTGMNPGYYLYNLARARHPAAEAAFNALSFHLTPTATTPEYQILDDGAPLHFLYDALGGVGDYTARYRPWEGAINADAALTYLLGLVFDAPHARLTLSPNLPNDWDFLTARDIRVGNRRLELSAVCPEPGTRTFRLTLNEGADVSVTLQQTLAGDAVIEHTHEDGNSVVAAVTELPWDNRVVQFPPPDSTIRGNRLVDPWDLAALRRWGFQCIRP